MMNMQVLTASTLLFLFFMIRTTWFVAMVVVKILLIALISAVDWATKPRSDENA